MNCNENILNYVSKCVNGDKMISSSDTIIDLGVNFDIFDFWYFYAKNIYLKNDIFKICFRQSAKCKMTAQTGEECMFLSNSAIYIVFYHQNFDFQAPTTFLFSLSN